MSSDTLGSIAPVLVGAPLLAATLLWIGPRRSGWRAGVVLVGLAVVGGALWLSASALVADPSHRIAASLELPALDGTTADRLWTVAPALTSVGFVGIAIRARSRVLALVAVAQVVVVVPSMLRDLSRTGGGPEEAGLVLDPLALVLLGVSVIVGGVIVVFALGYEPAHLRHTGQSEGRSNAFLGWLLVFLAAMHLLVLADDLRLLALGWELTTLCSFVLIGFDRDEPARAAANRALGYNLFGGAALAAAVWLAGPGARLTDVVAQPAAAGLTAVVAAFALAAATKSALAPFHPWLLGAMVAAAPVSALLHASTMVKAGSYLLLRLSPLFSEGWLGLLVAAMGAFSFAAAALLALRERDLKRVLALSTVASLGLIAAAAGVGSALALAAGLVFLVLHAVAKALAFLVVGATEQATGTRDLEALVGIGRTRPALAWPLLLAAAAMALPPFGIAVAKWALLLETGGRLVIFPLLAVGAAASVALWAGVAGRIIVRRKPLLTGGEPVGWSEGVAIGVLTAGTAVGLVAAGPLATTVGDPAAAVAFGQAAPLASGWDAIAQGGLFPVLPLAVALVAVVAGSALYLWRQPVRPEAYLSGLNVAAGTGVAFNGPRGRPEMAASGGFYWGGAMGDSSHPTRLRRAVEIGGWLGIVAIGAAALLGLAGWPGGL
jgi:ech hydrogenase subunit A